MVHKKTAKATLTFSVSVKELQKYGWSPRQQVKKNPRVRKMLKKMVT